MQWIIENKEWLFSGLGAVMLSLFVGRPKKKEPEVEAGRVNNTITITSMGGSMPQPASEQGASNEQPLEVRKSVTRILFIDDDSKFQVVQILKKSGWVYTKTIKDVKSIDCPEVYEANILFVDIQGVGKQLGFADEGLGLADAIKKKYPNKKVIIYSAETKGDRFHKALRNVDSFLPKNADPYEFQQIIEELSLGK